MFITKTSLSRRAVLRGMGASLALPLLDAMVPALTAARQTAASPRRRFGTVFVPQAYIEKVVDLGERITRRQDGMVEAVRSGRSVAEVMHDTQFEAIQVERS